jgi:hypothetical protein
MKKLSRNEWVAVVVSLFVVGFFFIFGSGLLSVLSKNKTALQESAQLKTQDVVMGTGEVATPEARSLYTTV